MSKLNNRIKKTFDHCRNVVLCLASLDNLQEYIDTFNTVFLINPKKITIKSKNLVVIEDYSNVFNIPDINLIVFDQETIKFTNHFKSIMRLQSPTIYYIGDRKLISSESMKPFVDSKYNITETKKDLVIWKKDVNR